MIMPNIPGRCSHNQERFRWDYLSIGHGKMMVFSTNKGSWIEGILEEKLRKILMRRELTLVKRPTNKTNILQCPVDKSLRKQEASWGGQAEEMH
jgi:hypothetical protein